MYYKCLVPTLLSYMYVYEVNGKINEWMNDMNE